MSPLSFKTRLWLGHVAVLAAMLVVAAIASDWGLRRVVLDHIIDNAIRSLAATEAAALQADTTTPVRVHEIVPGPGPPSLTRLDKFVQIIDLDGQVVARSTTLGSARLPLSKEHIARVRDGEMLFLTVTDFAEEPVRMVSMAVHVGDVHYIVQVATSLDDAYAVLRSGRWLFLGMSLALLVGIGWTSAVLARRAVRPIEEIVSRVRTVGERNLAERLPDPGTRDEIGQLVATLNGMLDRLERSFEIERRFTADASHELRSPISRLRAELEVTLRRPRVVADYEETLRSCLDEVERVQALIEELLELARIDARQEPEHMAPVPLTEIIDAAVAAVKPEADRRDVAVGVEREPDVLVNAAPSAAKVALANILDNAVKFSPPGGEVMVAITANQREASIAVSDSGPGVSLEDASRLFERFYRGKASRASGIPGLGLGLAISRALVEGQGGRVSVEMARTKGATFSIHLPRA